MNNLIRFYLRKVFRSPSFYAATGLFAFCSELIFFIGTRFFSSAGSTNLHPFFTAASSLLILYVPFLMQFFFTGERELWLPESDLNIVTGKILSAFLSFCCTEILFIPFFLAVSFFGSLDFRCVILESLGLLISSLSCISFCTFIFSKIQKKAHAAIVSTFILVILNLVHLLPYYAGVNLTSGLLNFFSPVLRSESFSKGLFSTNDFIFFISSAVFLTVLTVLEHQKKRGNAKLPLKRIKLLSFTAFLLLLVDSGLIQAKIDFTASKKYSLSDVSKKIASLIDEPLELTYYRTSSLRTLLPGTEDASYFLKSYAQENPYIYYSEKDASKKEIQSQLLAEGIRGETVSSGTDDTLSVTKIYSAVTITYRGKTETIPYVPDIKNLEYDLTLRIEHLITGKHRIIQLVQGGNLDYSADLSYLIPYLEYNGFTPVRTAVPSESFPEAGLYAFSDFPEVPVLITGSEAFTKEDMKALEDYILHGGKAFIASSPFSVNLEDSWKITKGDGRFERMLFTFGIYFDENPLCDTKAVPLTLYPENNSGLKKEMTEAEKIPYPFWPELPPQENAQKGMALFWPASMHTENDIAEIEGFSVKPVLYSSDTSWNQKGNADSFDTNPFTALKNPENSGEQKSHVCAAEVLKNGESRAVVFTSPLSFCTKLIPYSSGKEIDLRALDFLTASLLKLSGYGEFSKLKDKFFFDDSLSKIKEEPASYREKVILILFIITSVLCMVPYMVFSRTRRKFRE
ncbi:MAG: Gldg family protein [Treponema sp.]|nr:Gldg family protein [Treponema sp.]